MKSIAVLPVRRDHCDFSLFPMFALSIIPMKYRFEIRIHAVYEGFVMCSYEC